MIVTMSRSSLLVRCLGFVLVFCQLLTPLNGGPIIGEDFSKETSYVSESVLSSPEPTTSLPSTSYSTTTKSPSTHQPSESSKKPTTQQPNVESSSYKTAHKTTPKKTEYEPNHSAPHKNDVYDRWGFEPKPTVEVPWSHKDPGAWAAKYPTCGGLQQSPVDIQPKSTVLTAYPKFTFHNYGSIAKMLLTNNGHSALYSLPSDFPKEQMPYITGGGLTDRYNFVQIHMHWGSDSTKGSEHLIKSKSYPAELHIIHWNSKYGSFAEATMHPDGLAVFAVFVKIGPSDSETFQPLVQQLGEVTKDGDETILNKQVSISDLLPSRTTSFYRYNGSLSTPGCDEIVVWTVFDNPIVISEQQIAKFRKLIGSDGTFMKDNFRPPMPLNGRVITYRSFTGCEISQSWPITSSPFSEAYKWSRCLMGFAFRSLTSSS